LVYDHAWCKEYCKDFIVALTISDVFNKEQMYECNYSVITGKKMLFWRLALYLIDVSDKF